MDNVTVKKGGLDKYKIKHLAVVLLPFVALAVLFAVLCIVVAAKDYRLDMYLKIIFNEGVVLAIVATGAIFIYTLGGRYGDYHSPYDTCDKCGIEDSYEKVVSVILNFW